MVQTRACSPQTTNNLVKNHIQTKKIYNSLINIEMPSSEIKIQHAVLEMATNFYLTSF